MRDLKTITTELSALNTEFTDAIAATYPKGSKLYVRSKYGWEWELAEVTWTPERSSGANQCIHVKRERTGGVHKIDMQGANCFDMVRKTI